ncbi:YceI family protein [Pedobacter sp. HMF7647]|uniref:YceI family protein n=1 Tax=Hufsiella arboris TaxID=2695275 RepID=A0A7K1YET6_9SPHI|nr:YceI family protein [Hufsiella arboris]MXV52901.1 YceI family protein [Hufsiella arboris]
MKHLKLLALILITVVSGTSCKKHQNTKKAVYQLADSSVAGWKGFLKTGYFNEGTIKVSGSDIETDERGHIRSGSFRMPLSSLQNNNLPTDELKHMLIHHLQSADFFNMALHPEISFVITSASFVTSAPTQDQYVINGNLTILGKTKPVTFPAKINLADNKITIEAQFEINRLDWGITYASDDTLPDDQFINPKIAISLNLNGIKSMQF